MDLTRRLVGEAGPVGKGTGAVGKRAAGGLQGQIAVASSLSTAHHTIVLAYGTQPPP